MKRLPQEAIDNHLRDHLPYEEGMLRHTFSKISDPSLKLPNEDWNAYYESFAVHARNVSTFLSNGDNNNVSAGHFIAGFKERTPANLTGPLGQLNNQVLHIGPTRPTESEKKVNVEKATEIYRWLSEKLEGFKNRLPSEMRERWNKRITKDTPAAMNLGLSNLGSTASGGPTQASNITIQVTSGAPSSSAHPSFNSTSTMLPKK
jgi:hypothetical protein